MAKAFGAALRNLGRAPAFTGLVVVTLALGIGATTAMFTVVDAVLLRPLPYPGIERFAELYTSQPDRDRIPGVVGTALPRLRQELADVAAVEGYQMGSATITGGREPDLVGAPRITPQLLSLVGATPHLGRLFNADDLQAAVPSVIISHKLWSSTFGSASDIVGRQIQIDDIPHTVIGVMSRRVRYPEANADIWRPLDLAAAGKSRQRVMTITVRFPTVTAEQFTARLGAVVPALREAQVLPQNQTLHTGLLLQERFGRSDSRGFWMMFGAVTLVLLVACVNVSNLLLARASRQHAETALRSALGASRARLVGASLAEALLLSAISGVVGVVLAQVLLTLLLRILPPQLTYLTASASEIDARVVAFAVFLSLLTCLLSGLLPALRTSKADPMDAIKQHASTVAGRRDDWWQSILLSGQLSIVLVLLAGAGLLLRSFLALSNVNPGFDVRGLSTVDVLVNNQHYPDPVSTYGMLRDLEQRLEATGTMRVTIAGGAPVLQPAIFFNVKPEAEGGIDRDFTGMIMPRNEVGADYFATLGIAVLAGREFTSSDGDDVAIVNDKLAAHYWGEQSPIGRRFRIGAKETWRTVVGVVGDVKQMALNDPMAHGMEIYFPHAARQAGGFFSIIARSDRDPLAAIALIKQTLWSIDGRIPVMDAMPMTDRFGESLYRQRFFVRLSGAFTLIATALAMIGIYGTTTYWVVRRRRELAIRLAIGASPRTVMTAVVMRALRLAVIGGAVGVLIALSGARVIRSMLFTIEARDPVTLAIVGVLLLVVALISCSVPAVKAARVDPMTTLRAE